MNSTALEIDSSKGQISLLDIPLPLLHHLFLLHLQLVFHLFIPLLVLHHCPLLLRLFFLYTACRSPPTTASSTDYCFPISVCSCLYFFSDAAICHRRHHTDWVDISEPFSAQSYRSTTRTMLPAPVVTQPITTNRGRDMANLQDLPESSEKLAPPGSISGTAPGLMHPVVQAAPIPTSAWVPP